jgi:hypothetical protein
LATASSGSLTISPDNRMLVVGGSPSTPYLNFYGFSDSGFGNGQFATIQSGTYNSIAFGTTSI